MEQTDEWPESRRYMGPELLAKTRLRILNGQAGQEDQEPAALTS